MPVLVIIMLGTQLCYNRFVGAVYPLHEACFACREWPSQDLADMLMGEQDTLHQSVLQSALFMFGCLAKALKDKTLTRQDISNALVSASLKPFLEHLSGQQLAWLQRHMQLTADSASVEVVHQFANRSLACSLNVVKALQC